MVTTQQQLAIVTGAAGGIGAVLCERLHSDGWQVLAVDCNEAGLSALRERGFRTSALDLREAGEIDAFAHQIGAEGLSVGALVNNAALTGGLPIAAQTLDEWNEFFAVNVTAPWLLSKLLLPAFASDASILNIGSPAALTGFAGRAAYTASKHALAGLTKALAAELAPDIRVNMVCPGTIDTPRMHEVAGERLGEYVDRQLLGRMGQPKEIASAVSFLVSDQATFFTGSVVTVDGGMMVKTASG